MAAYEKQGESNEWYTPQYIFDALDLVFDMDVACPANGPFFTPCVEWISPLQNGLVTSWKGLVWMNAPFGHQRHKRIWLDRFFAHGSGIALVPDRTSAPWFQEFAPMADAICWVSPKVKFVKPDGTTGDSPGTGTALLASGRISVAALARSGLGIVTPRALAA